MSDDLREFPGNVAELEAALRQRDQWIADLQTGCFLNCIACGFRLDPNVGPTLRDSLYAHAKDCPGHPWAELRRVVRQYFRALDRSVALADAVTTIEREHGAGEGRLRLYHAVLDLGRFTLRSIEDLERTLRVDVGRVSVEPLFGEEEAEPGA